jgi:hypothetical protein
LENVGAGVLITAGSANIIGGGDPGAGNVISGNDSVGVHIISTNSHDNIIQGNLIGTDASGSVLLGNTRFGIWIYDSPNNVIGGDLAGDGNVISANGAATSHPGAMGIFVQGNDANGNQIVGNKIGTDITGSIAMGNSVLGIGIYNGSSNNIGGLTPGSGNLICANGFVGVRIYGQFADNNMVQGNYIGTNSSGASDLGNVRHGVSLVDAKRTLVGGIGPGAGNIIAYNQWWGVVVGNYEDHAYGNYLRGNSIHSNGELGINLLPGISDDGVTPNDSLDADTGGNDLQNYPVLTSAASDVNTLSGYLHSTPGSEFRLEFFRNSSADPSGYGEGETFIGSLSIMTDVYGDVDFNVLLPEEIHAGQFYTATATNPDSSTSEFSAAIETEIRTKTFGPHYIVNTTYNGVPLHWPDGRAEFVVSQSVVDIDPAFKTAIETGYATWSTLTELDYSYSGVLTDPVASNRWGGDPDGYNNNVWITDWDATGLGEDVVAVTRVRYNAITGEMTDVDIAYNADDMTWSANTVPDQDPDPGKLDVCNVATHEIGHYSGLGDIYDPDDDPYYLETNRRCRRNRIYLYQSSR